MPSLEILVALASASLAGYSLYVSRRSEAHIRTIEAVTTLYDEFDALGQLRVDNWELAHLLELPENYESAWNNVRLAVGPLDDMRQHELLIRERAVANRIFSLFEQVHYYATQAKQEKRTERLAFLGEVLEYFTGRLLCNPRLRYIWDPDGGNAAAYFEPDVLDLYRRSIKPISDISPGLGSGNYDPDGPF